MTTPSIRRSVIGVAVFTALVLLLVALAMQLDTGFDWGPGDFVAAGLLVFVAGSAIVLGWQRVQGQWRRAVLVGGVLLFFATVWAELAVGLFH